MLVRIENTEIVAKAKADAANEVKRVAGRGVQALKWITPSHWKAEHERRDVMKREASALFKDGSDDDLVVGRVTICLVSYAILINAEEPAEYGQAMTDADLLSARIYEAVSRDAARREVYAAQYREAVGLTVSFVEPGATVEAVRALPAS